MGMSPEKKAEIGKTSALLLAGFALSALGLLFAVKVLGCRGTPALTTTAIAFGALMQILWLPLIALPFTTSASSALKALSAASIGAFLANAGFAIFQQSPLMEIFWSQAITLSFAFLTTGLSTLLSRLFSSLKTGNMCGITLLFFAISSPFWTGEICSGIEHGIFKTILKQACVWISPAACLSTAFDTFNFAHLPRIYSIWFGSLAPYPSHPAWVAGVYGGIGIVMMGASLAIKHEE